MFLLRHLECEFLQASTTMTANEEMVMALREEFFYEFDKF